MAAAPPSTCPGPTCSAAQGGRRIWRSPAVAAVLVAVLAAVGPACSRSDRTALAIQGATWQGPDRLELTTECATEVAVAVDAEGELPRITLWGRPAVGRCHPPVTVAVPAGTRQVVDGTTSMVVDLPPRG